MVRKYKKISASILVIGNEILSGRTKDQNVSYLASWLNTNLGISDKVSCPTEANINPNTTIIIAFKKCPFAENADTAVNPRIMRPK